MIEKEFQNVKELTKNEGVKIIEAVTGLKLLDLGLEAPGGWSAGKSLIETTINNLGKVNFGEFDVEGFSLPSVHVYLDNPVKTMLPKSKIVKGKLVYHYEESQLLYMEMTKPLSLSEIENIGSTFENNHKNTTLVVTSPTSLVSAIYGCSLTPAIITEKLLRKSFLKEEILWACSSTSLPPLADNIEIMKSRMKAALEYGTISSFWVRAEDEKIKEVLSGMGLCGELRIHNLSTARTFVHGAVHKSKLKEVYNI